MPDSARRLRQRRRRDPRAVRRGDRRPGRHLRRLPRAGRVELYVLVDSIRRVPLVLRPYFERVVCSQSACAALAAPSGGEDSLWLDFDTMKFTTHYSRVPVQGARDACSQQ